MKITGFRTFLVDAHRANYSFVKLQTDSGIEGLGEFLIGKDPFATDYLIQLMHRNS